jgi:hypothetical protein
MNDLESKCVNYTILIIIDSTLIRSLRGIQFFTTRNKDHFHG